CLQMTSSNFATRKAFRDPDQLRPITLRLSRRRATRRLLGKCLSGLHIRSRHIVLIPPRSLKGAAMADLKNSRAQSRLEKAAREGGNTWVGYEAEAKAVREKIARLKALRIAKEAAGKSAAAVDESAAARKPATKRAVKSGGAPPMSADRSKD